MAFHSGEVTGWRPRWQSVASNAFDGAHGAGSRLVARSSNGWFTVPSAQRSFVLMITMGPRFARLTVSTPGRRPPVLGSRTRPCAFSSAALSASTRGMIVLVRLLGTVHRCWRRPDAVWLCPSPVAGDRRSRQDNRSCLLPASCQQTPATRHSRPTFRVGARADPSVPVAERLRRRGRELSSRRSRGRARGWAVRRARQGRRRP